MESKSLTPVFHLMGSRVETGRFQAVGELDSTCTAPLPCPRGTRCGSRRRPGSSGDRGWRHKAKGIKVKMRKLFCLAKHATVESTRQTWVGGRATRPVTAPYLERHLHVSEPVAHVLGCPLRQLPPEVIQRPEDYKWAPWLLSSKFQKLAPRRLVQPRELQHRGGGGGGGGGETSSCCDQTVDGGGGAGRREHGDDVMGVVVNAPSSINTAK
jgi:hypothetical protein